MCVQKETQVSALEGKNKRLWTKCFSLQVVLIQHLEYPSSTIVTGMTSAVFLFPLLHSGVDILFPTLRLSPLHLTCICRHDFYVSSLFPSFSCTVEWISIFFLHALHVIKMKSPFAPNQRIKRQLWSFLTCLKSISFYLRTKNLTICFCKRSINRLIYLRCLVASNIKEKIFRYKQAEIPRLLCAVSRVPLWSKARPVFYEAVSIVKPLVWGQTASLIY